MQPLTSKYVILARPTGNDRRLSFDCVVFPAYFEPHLNSLFKFNIILFNYIFKPNYIVNLNKFIKILFIIV